MGLGGPSRAFFEPSPRFIKPKLRLKLGSFSSRAELELSFFRAEPEPSPSSLARYQPYLKELPLEELIGSLMTYEMKIARQEKEMQEESKKKSIALKAQEEKVIQEAKLSNMEDDIALITKRMQKFMMKNKFGGKTYNKRSNYKKEGPSKEEK